MDILDNADVQTFSVDTPMTELVDMSKPVAGLPQGAIRNRAATSAIIQGDPTRMVDSYQTIMREADDGQDTTHKTILDQAAQSNKQGNLQHVIQVLGDRSIPLAQKQNLLNFVQNDTGHDEPANTLAGQALAASNPGEDIRGEAARIRTADIFAEMQKEREDRQKQLNGFLATLPEASAGTIGELAEADVLPFGRNIIGARVAQAFNPGSLGSWVKNFLLPGSTKQDLQEKLNSVPLDKRPEYTAKLLASIKDSATVFHSDNYFAQFQTAVDLLENPIRTGGEAWTENMSTVLDAFWVGSIARSARTAAGVVDEGVAAGTRARRPGSANPGVSDAENVVHKADWEVVQDTAPPSRQIPSGQKRIPYNAPEQEKKILQEAVVRRENPVAPYSVIEQVNPSQARDLHKAMVASAGDELSEAITGVSREQALANNISAQVGTDSGAVLNKVNQDLQEIIGNTGALRYTTDELGGAVATVSRDFRTATGMEINDAMTTIKVDGDHLLIDAHYTTAGGAWVTPEGAKEQAKYALRQYGIRDGEIEVLARSGNSYVPATGTNAGDYVVKVKTRHPISDTDVQDWSPLDVKKNFFDRISQTGSEDKGSVTTWLFDPGSILHPTLTSSASIATDQAVNIETKLLTPIKTLRDQIGAMKIDRRQAVEAYMKEANFNSLKHDPFVLTARGFSQSEIDSLELWRDIWDGHYYLENFDLVRTLRSQNYQILDTGTDRFFARPIAKNQNIGRVYDPASGTTKAWSKADMDSLYNQNGTFATLRRPVAINGDTIEHIVVRNTPSEYLRTLRDTDPVLNYREGYYTVNYKSPKFIDEITTDSAGKEVRRTVAVAGTTADADMFVNSQTASTGVRHEVREDARGFRKDGDGYWDLNEASGRIAQRMRGQPLTQARGVNSLGVGTHIENPMESAQRAAKSLAGRSISRPVLETAKRRFVSQYGDFLPEVKFGDKAFPSNRSEIVDHVSHTSSKVADARTTYSYIKYLENGYINSADEVFKGGMNVLADILGKYHLSTGERVARAVGNVAISHKAKSTVFQAYIAFSNPIRQWLVQSHQVGQTIAYNPIGWVNGEIPKRIAGYLGIQSTLVEGSQLAKDFTRFVEESGMVAGVDKNSLVRGMGLDMADSSYGAKRLAIEALSIPQRVGFDLGEKMNQIGHLAAVHDRYTRAGKDLFDKTVRDQALTEARALSWDLNRAGELAYTQSTPALFLQFLQMPHKAVLVATNRKLPFAVKARMIGWNTVMFGSLGTAGAGAIGYIKQQLFAPAPGETDSLLPDNPELREFVVEGVEAYGLNKLFTQLDDSGDKTRVDFSSLNAYDLDGWAKMYSAFIDKGAFGALAASPAGQLVSVDGSNGSTRNGRIPQALMTMGRFFNVIDEIDPENPTQFSNVLKDVAKISSGWTAADKAKIMLETRKKFDSLGRTVDSTITTPEVLAAFVGFGTRSTKDLYETSKFLSESKKKHEEQLMNKYRDITRYYADALNTENADVQHIQKVSSMLMRTFQDPADRAFVVKQWQNDMLGPEQKLFKQMMDASQMPNTEKLLDTIKLWPVDQQTKDRVTQRVLDFKAQREFNKGK